MLADEFLSLPIYPELLPEQVAEVVSTLKTAAPLEFSRAIGREEDHVSAEPNNRRAS